MRLVARIGALVGILLFVALPLRAHTEQHDHHGGVPGRLGIVSFPISYWASQVDVGIRAVKGWVAHTDAHNDEAETLLRSAADLEDSMDKSPVTPGSVLPAREMLGDFLVDVNRPRQALEAYERSLKDSPRRLNALSGAAHAAQMAGDREKARECYLQVAKLLEPREKPNRARDK